MNAPVLELRCAECHEAACTPDGACEHGAPACIECADCAAEDAEREWLATASEEERLGKDGY